MKKIKPKTQRAAIVSKFLVLSLLIIGCVSKKELIQTNDDTTILNLYLKDIVATQKKDSIFIAPKNSKRLFRIKKRFFYKNT